MFYRREHFQSHLKDGHKINDEDYIRDQLKRHQIGRNGQTAFWCGFCQKIVKLHKQGLEAWDERFNHIDDNHFKNGCGIEHWYELDRDIPNGLLRNGRSLDTSNSDESDDNGLGDSSGNTQVHSPDAPSTKQSAPNRKRKKSGDGKGSGNGGCNSPPFVRWVCVSTCPIDAYTRVEISAHRSNSVIARRV